MDFQISEERAIQCNVSIPPSVGSRIEVCTVALKMPWQPRRWLHILEYQPTADNNDPVQILNQENWTQSSANSVSFLRYVQSIVAMLEAPRMRVAIALVLRRLYMSAKERDFSARGFN